MSLFGKIVGTDPIKVPIHGIMGALNEWADGAKTRQNVIDFLELDTADEADLDYLKSKYVAASDKTNFMSVLLRLLTLAEIENRLRNDPNYTGTLLGYDIKANFVARINAIAV